MTALLALLALSGQDSMLGHTRDVWCVAVSPDGKTVASGSTDKSMRLWHPAGVTVFDDHDGDVYSVAFSPDGQLIATGEIYKKARIFDASGTLKTTIEGFEGPVTGVAFSPDSQFVYASCVDNTVRKFAVTGGEAVAKGQNNYQVDGVKVGMDGTVGTVDGNGSVRTWRPDLSPIATETHGTSVRCLAFSPDGTTLATGGGDGPLFFWAATGGKLDSRQAGPKLDAMSLAFSPDGKTLALGTFDNLVVLVDVASRTVRAKHEKHERPVTGVAWSPDGKTVYSSSMDMTVRRWKVN